MVAGDFREDLYYRLKVIEVAVPAAARTPGRDPAPHRLLHRPSTRAGTTGRRPPLSAELRQLFLEHDWPGNMRELENMIKRLVILQDEQLVVRELKTAAARVPAGRAPGPAPVRTRPSHSPRTPPPPARSPRRGRGRTAGASPRTGAASRRSPAPPRSRRSVPQIERTLDQVHWNRRKAARDPRGELQDAAQQNQGVRDQPEVKPFSFAAGDCPRGARRPPHRAFPSPAFLFPRAATGWARARPALAAPPGRLPPRR